MKINQPTALNEESAPDLSKKIIHIEREGAHLILHRNKPAWLVVNEMGWEIIQSLNGKNSLKNIAERITKRYQIDPLRASNDIKTYLSRLSEAGFSAKTQGVSKKSFKPAITRLHLNITEKCNLNCVHCGIMNSPPDTPQKIMAKEIVFKIIDEISMTKGSAIAISGGEPLTHKNWLEILTYASEKLPTTLSTNATLITKPTARLLADLSVPVQISFDGAYSGFHNDVRGPGNFEKTDKAIGYLIAEGLASRISLCVTLMKQNIDQIHKIITYAESKNIPNIRFLQVQRMGNAASKWEAVMPTHEKYKNFYERIYLDFKKSSVNISPGLQGFLLNIPEERWCNVGSMLAIRADGGIYPCTLMFHDEFLLGNIHHVSLKQAIESEKLKNLTHQCSIRKTKIVKCQACDWKNFCQACCPGSLFFEKGSMMEADDFCDIRKHLYETFIFRFAKNKSDPVLKKIAACEP